MEEESHKVKFIMMEGVVIGFSTIAQHFEASTDFTEHFSKTHNS